MSEETGATVTTARPAGHLGEVIGTLFGLAHEGKLTDDGRPRLLQAMVLTDELADDTVFTSPPPVIARALSALLAPIARARGYAAIYPKYDEASFWEALVEQPVSTDNVAEIEQTGEESAA